MGRRRDAVGALDEVAAANQSSREDAEEPYGRSEKQRKTISSASRRGAGSARRGGGRRRTTPPSEERSETASRSRPGRLRRLAYCAAEREEAAWKRTRPTSALTSMRGRGLPEDGAEEEEETVHPPGGEGARRRRRRGRARYARGSFMRKGARRGPSDGLERTPPGRGDLRGARGRGTWRRTPRTTWSGWRQADAEVDGATRNAERPERR
jgi:hypothetical protein